MPTPTLVYRVNSKLRKAMLQETHAYSDCDCENDSCLALQAQEIARCSEKCSMPEWDSRLAAKARSKARELAEKDSMAREYARLGKRKNVYVSAHDPSFEDAVNAWVAEEELSNELSNGRGPDELCMWHRTRRFGMGRAVSETGHTYIVARYMPQGRP